MATRKKTVSNTKAEIQEAQVVSTEVDPADQVQDLSGAVGDKPAEAAPDKGSPEFEDDITYDVEVSRVVTDGPFKYRPRDQIVAKGSLINRIIERNGRDAIRSAVAR